MVTMELIEPHTLAIICGDTDSLKVFCERKNIEPMNKELERLSRAIDKAKGYILERVKRNFPEYYDELEGMGHYILEAEYEAFAAAWNKSYISLKDDKIGLTIAGLPTSSGEHSVEAFFQELYDDNQVFAPIANMAIGYNVTYDFSLTKLNSKSHPSWIEFFDKRVKDYQGNTAHVFEPRAIALYPEPKTIGDTSTYDNNVNSYIALENNPNVNIDPIMLRWDKELGKVVEGWI